MDWMNWKTWTAAALIIVAGFAIYVFAAPELRPGSGSHQNVATPSESRPMTQKIDAPGVEPIHIEWLDPETGSFKSDRNLFSYVEPPPPPPPAPPPPPPPPP